MATKHKDCAKARFLTNQSSSRRDAMDERERKLLWSLPFHRSCIQRYNEDGILLPFRSTRESFTVPNPTLFYGKDWLMAGKENPFDGWNFDEICNVDIGPTTNDISGKLYYYVKALLRRFRRRLLSLDCYIRLFSLNVTQLPPLLSPDTHLIVLSVPTSVTRPILEHVSQSQLWRRY